MSITVASLVAKMGYDDGDFQKGIEGSNSKVSQLGSLIKTGLAVGVTAMAASLTAVAASVVSVQDALTPVMTLLGKGTDEFKLMSAGIKDVIKSSPKSADEIGMSAYTVLSAGITDTTEATLALKDANDLALAGLGSVPEATGLITSAMNSWKDANLSSTDAAKVFFGTIASGKTTTQELAQGFGGIAPLAASVGVSFQDLMSATAALTATGMPASQAYSGLKAAISNILKPSTDASKAAENLGIDFSSAALKSKGLIGFLQDVAKGTNGATDAITDLFPAQEAMNTVFALTGPQASAMADNFTNIAIKGEGLAQTAKDVSETFSNRLKIMKNNTLIELSEIGEKGLDWLSAKWKEWGPGITAVMDSFKANLAAIFDSIKADFASFVTGWTSSGDDSPSGFFETLGSVARGIYEDILQVFRDIKTGFNDFITGWNSGTVDTPGTPSGFFENLGDKASDVKNRITKVFDDLKQGFIDFNAGWLSGTADRPGSPAGFFENFGDKAADANDKIKNLFIDMGAAFTEFNAVLSGSGGRQQKEGWLGGVDAIALFVRDQLPGLNSQFDDLTTNVQDLGKAFQSLNDDVDWGNLSTVIGGTLVGTVAVARVQIWLTTGAVWGLTGAINGLRGLVVDELVPAISLIASVFNQELFPALDLIGRMVAGPVVGLFRLLTRVVNEEVWPALKLFGRVINEEIVPALGFLTGAIGMIPGALDGLGRAVVSAAKTVLGWLDWLGHSIVNIFAGSGTWLWNAGWNLIVGLINGINAKVGDLIGTINGIAGKITAGFAHALGVRSPSTIARQQGAMYGEGLMLGLQDKVKAIQTVSAQVAGAMVDATQYTYNVGGPGSVAINMPHGSNGNDVVRALKDWQRVNGKVPISVSG